MTLMKVLKKLIKKADAKHIPSADRDRYLWDILTALRGPDHSDEPYLKDDTTARIRGILGMEYPSPSGCLINKTLFPSDYDFHNRKGGNHFSLHIGKAVQSLRKLGYKVS